MQISGRKQVSKSRRRIYGRSRRASSGRGDRPAVADDSPAEDLVAVSMLSVRVDNAALGIPIHRRNGLRQMLRAILTDTRLATLPAEEIGPDRAVRRLLPITDIGDTAASKLLARNDRSSCRPSTQSSTLSSHLVKR